VLAWPWRPNWRDPPRERLEWKTDVMEAWDGTEQRVRLREYPRQSCEFTVTAAGMERRKLSSALWDWQAKDWHMPIWHDETRLTSGVSAGATTLACDTRWRNWFVGGPVVISDGARAEAVTLSAVASDSSLTVGATTLNWPAGSRCAPARLARITAVTPRAVKSPDISEWNIAWETDDVTPGWSGTDGPDTYLGAPVLTQRPGWKSGVSSALERRIEEFDGSVGSRLVVDRTGSPLLRTELKFTRGGRAAVKYLRLILWQRAGRYAGIWMPTFERDLILTADYTSGVTQIDVEMIGYTDYLIGLPGRKDIRILMIDGSREYARITTSSEISPSVERLTLAGPTSVALTRSNIAQISFMGWSRLSSDAIEFVYSSSESISVATEFIS
jgi:hypothetical protein